MIGNVLPQERKIPERERNRNIVAVPDTLSNETKIEIQARHTVDLNEMVNVNNERFFFGVDIGDELSNIVSINENRTVRRGDLLNLEENFYNVRHTATDEENQWFEEISEGFYEPQVEQEEEEPQQQEQQQEHQQEQPQPVTPNNQRLRRNIEGRERNDIFFGESPPSSLGRVGRRRISDADYAQEEDEYEADEYDDPPRKRRRILFEDDNEE